MARNVAAACAAALALSTLSGCGTIYNNAFSGDAYGGVRKDVAAVRSVAADAAAKEPVPPSRVTEAAYLLFVDLPLCAIGDTFSLPYFLYQRARKGY